jgi:aspartate/methionine/tyrosine aminotransferase
MATMDAYPVGVLGMIDELDQSEAIEGIVDRYHVESGDYPVNVSHWNSSSEFREKLMRTLRFAQESDPLSYIFSEALDGQDALMTKLGFDPGKHGCIVVPNGTIATLCVANWIASAGLDRMTVLCPNYFATLQQGRLLNIRVRKRYIRRHGGEYSLPEDVAAIEDLSTPLWVTNPIYCTGVLQSKSSVRRLGAFLDAGGTVIVDECVAWPGSEIGPELSLHKGFIGIYSPHKSVAVNGLKFAVVIFDRSYQRFFRQWTDVLHGGLSISNVVAVKHFLSDNFSEYLQTFRAEITRTFNFMEDLVQEYSGVELDREANGHFATVYFPDLPGDFDTDRAFVERMIRATAGIVIPGRRSHFPPSGGACFRVNLARDSPQFRAALVRLIRFLAAPEARAHFSSPRDT